jgi:hypothetical protein
VKFCRHFAAVYGGRPFGYEYPVNAVKNQAAIVIILDEIQKTKAAKHIKL